jgi:ABC-type sulfate transport system permease component
MDWESKTAVDRKDSCRDKNWKTVMKIVLVVLLLLVIISLFSGLFFMYRNKGNPNRMVNALKLRVAFSVIAFLIVIAGFLLGWFPRS